MVNKYKHQKISDVYFELSSQALQLVQLYEASKDKDNAEHYRLAYEEYLLKGEQYRKQGE